MFRMIPRREPFFGLFDRAAANAAEAARALQRLLADFTNVEERVAAITELEHEGDSITHEIAERLNRSFVTPLERDDIHALASALDNVVDRIEAAADELVLYRIEQPTEDARDLARILVEMTERLHHAVSQLRKPREYPDVRAAVVEINRLENDADRVKRAALAKLVARRHDDLWEFIRWRDIYDRLESATDDCEDVGDVLENIVLKHI